MTITAKEWKRYKDRLSGISKKAADLMQKYVMENGYEVDQALLNYAYSLTSKYGSAASELACIMYDDMAALWEMEFKQQMMFESAIPATSATFDDVAAAMKAASESAPGTMPSIVGRLVKQAGADTTLQNAARDGAEFAWVPSGDSCPFCMTLASRGWQRASKKSLKNGHAEHIHSNCDCTYAVRFDESTTIGGYNPEHYARIYYGAEGSTSREKINSLRREQYAENREKINAQKRAAYAARKEAEESK